MNIKRILIVDDHQATILGLESIVNQMFPSARVRKATDGKRALAILKKNVVHLLISDIEMPKMNGRELSMYAVKLQPEIKIVIVTQFPHHGIIRSLHQIENVWAVIDKADDLEAIERGINFALEDKKYYSPSIQAVIDEIVAQRSGKTKPPAQVTPRQREILIQMAYGATSREIAKKMSISRRTVEDYIENLRARFDAHNKTHLVHIATSYGLI